MNEHDVLVGALNEIEREGWGKGGPMSRSPGLCIGQALARGAGADSEVKEVHWIHGLDCADLLGIPAPFRSAVALVLAHVGWEGTLHRWNDWHCKGPDHAKEILRDIVSLTAPPPPDPDWSVLVEEAYA